MCIKEGHTFEMYDNPMRFNVTALMASDKIAIFEGMGHEFDDISNKDIEVCPVLYQESTNDDGNDWAMFVDGDWVLRQSFMKLHKEVSQDIATNWEMSELEATTLVWLARSVLSTGYVMGVNANAIAQRIMV